MTEKTPDVENEKVEEENGEEITGEMEETFPEDFKDDEAELESASNLSSELGSIRISDSIVAKVAGLTAGEVEGIAGMRRNVGSGITEAFSRKNVSRGVKVEATEKEALINLYVVVDYGVFITDVAREVQQKVKDAVEDFTGLHVKAVNVFVQGIQLPITETEEKKKK